MTEFILKFICAILSIIGLTEIIHSLKTALISGKSKTYSELYIYVPKESVCWISYDNRALVYLIDDKEYQLYDKFY